MKYQHKLDEMRENFDNGRFPLVQTQAQLDTMQRATQALIDSRQAENARLCARVLPLGHRGHDREFTGAPCSGAAGRNFLSRRVVPLLQS